MYALAPGSLPLTAAAQVWRGIPCALHNCANNCLTPANRAASRYFTRAKFGTGLASTLSGGATSAALVCGPRFPHWRPYDEMKKTLFLLCFVRLVSSSAAFAQLGTSSLSSEPQIYNSPSHPAHASYTPMSQEQNVLGGTNYFSAQGERPLSDFPQPEAVPLGALPANSSRNMRN